MRVMDGEPTPFRAFSSSFWIALSGSVSGTIGNGLPETNLSSLLSLMIRLISDRSSSRLDRKFFLSQLRKETFCQSESVLYFRSN